MRSKRLSIVVGVIACAIHASSVGAETQMAHMKTIGFTSQPIGHYEYCHKFAADCDIVSVNTTPTSLTRERWRQLVNVNSFSNDTIRPVSDAEFYDREEYWAYPVNSGDCEDYVLMKRKMLLDMGWPASSLLITIVRQKNGEAHAVLTVRTKRADYILDNLKTKILPWNQTGYVFLKRQAATHSGSWAAISS